MFWRFGFNSTSALDALLDKEGVTLEEVLVEDELIQEVKAQNTKLLAFLGRTDSIAALVALVADPLVAAQRLVAAEVFGCEAPSLTAALMEHPAAMHMWTLLDAETLHPEQAACFAKVILWALCSSAILFTHSTNHD